MNVQRSCLKFGRGLISRRWSLDKGILSRSSPARALSIVASPRNSGSAALVVPVQTSCHQFQVQRFLTTDETCVEHGKTDCNKCSKEVSLDELTQLLNGAGGEIQLVDVRESYELRDAGAIPKAINIPLTQLKSTFLLECDQFMKQLGLPKPTKSDNIVFYGMGYNRSVAALEIACKMGYKKGVLEGLKAEDFEKIFKAKKPGKDDPIIFSCLAGKRSMIALGIAEELGYSKARHYPGGWQEWSKSQHL